MLVLVHGLKDHSSRYAQFAIALAARGVAVRAFDLRGHGKSEGKRVVVRVFDDYLADLGEAVFRAQAAHPGKPLFLFGHSMGGTIVTLYTVTRKPDLRGLILSAPALKPGADISPFLVKITKFLGKVLPGVRVLKTANAQFSRDPAVVTAMDDDPLIDNRPGPARTAAQLLLAMERVREGAPSIKAPLLAMHGTGDKLTNPEGSRELVERAASKDKELKLFDGFFHDLVHEPGKEQVWEAIIAFVEKRS